MVSQDLEAVIHAEGEHVAVVGRHRVAIAAVGTVRVRILGRKGQRKSVSAARLRIWRALQAES